MKSFKDFYLSGSLENLKKFKSSISEYISGDWKQHEDSKFSENFIVFTYLGDKINKASVFLYIKNIDKLQFKVTNIIPMEKNSLDYDEYNQVLVKCVNECIAPCAKECHLNLELTGEDVGLEKYMSIKSASKLRMFSAAANKSTGSAHPCDQERWNDFICQTFIDDDKNVTAILGRWLVEEEGWNDEKAWELVCEYEQGISLLEYYKERYHE